MAQAPVPSLATSRLAPRAPLGCRVSRRAPVARSGTRPDPIVARDDDARRDPRTSEAPTLDRRGLLVGAAASCASAPLAARADTEDIAKAYDGYAATYDDRFTTELHNGVLRGIFLWTGSLKKYKEGRYNALIESGEPVHLFHSGIGRGIRDFGRLKMLSSTMVDQGDAQVPQIKFEMVGAADRLDEEPFAA